jgi:hypothetical protein
MKLRDILPESPVDINTIGDFSKGSSFTSKADRALVTNPIAVQKIKDFIKLEHTDFDFYFVNTKDARQYYELGQVKEDFLWDDLKIKPEQLRDGRIDKDNITVFFTNNKGDERMPMTPWVICHRLGHVFRRLYSWENELQPWVNRMLSEMLVEYGLRRPPEYSIHDEERNYRQRRAYQIALRHLCEAIGTFKSARDKNLRNEGEFHYELFAQYLNGGVKINPLPDRLVLGHRAFGKPIAAPLKKDPDVDYVHELEHDYTYYANAVLSEAEGKIFVM